MDNLAVLKIEKLYDIVMYGWLVVKCFGSTKLQTRNKQSKRNREFYKYSMEYSVSCSHKYL